MKNWLCFIMLWSGILVAAAPAAAEALHLRLTQAVALALMSNPDVLTDKNSEQAAAVSVERARGLFLPRVSASGQGRRHWLKKSAGGEAADYETMDLSLTATLNLFNGFSDVAGLAAARRDLGAAGKTLDRQRQTTAQAAAGEFITLLTDDQLVEVAASNLESQRELLRQIEAFQRAGSRPVTDLYRQQAETAQAEQDWLDSRRTREVDALQLVKTLGLEPPVEVTAAAPRNFEMTRYLPEADLNTAYSQALTLRPDLLAQTLKMEAADERIREARAGYYPSVDLVAGAGTGYSNIASHRSVSRQIFDDNPDAQIGLNISIPIFDGDQVRTSVALARLDRSGAAIDFNALRQQIGQEVGTALTSYRSARQQLTVATAKLKYSRQAWEAAQARYQVGASTWVELSEARSAYIDARNGEVKARHEVLRQGLAVAYARGDIETVLVKMAEQDQM